MNIAVIGTGYVGLVTGACLAELGNRVICMDTDENKIKLLQRGRTPIFEPGLEEIVKKNSNNGKLFFTTDTAQAVKESEIVFIAVGTPPKESGEADLRFVESAAIAIARAAETAKIVVEKSTVPVGSGERIKRILEANDKGICFEVVSNPEFLREGSAVKDFFQPDRIVIGAESAMAKKAMKKLFAPLNAPIVFTDIRSAELIKYASNAFLPTKISFINAIANICERAGANINDVALGMGMDKRIGKSFLNAGIGYGGSCFPKDVEAFIKTSEKLGYDFSLLKEVQRINQGQRKMLIKKLWRMLSGLRGKRIAVLGLAFKPNTDDMRYAPSIEIVNALLKKHAHVSAFDPRAEENAAKLFGERIELNRSPYEAVKGADALLLLTEWEIFKRLDFNRVKALMQGNVILDGRNALNPNHLKRLGFNYAGVGI